MKEISQDKDKTICSTDSKLSVENLNKSDNQWHRTFSQQSTQYTINIGMIVTAWGMVSVALVGVIFYLLKNILFG